jgi:hypothetical protein
LRERERLRQREIEGERERLRRERKNEENRWVVLYLFISISPPPPVKPCSEGGVGLTLAGSIVGTHLVADMTGENLLIRSFCRGVGSPAFPVRERRRDGGREEEMEGGGVAMREEGIE